MSSRSIGVLALVGIGVLGSTACGLALGIKDITVDQGAGGGTTSATSSKSASTASAGGSTASTASSASSSGTTAGTGGSGGCMANITNDAHNCGACGHDCQGTMCIGSICQTISLAEGQDQPGPIAIDSATVYWMNVNTPAVEMVAKTGGAMPKLVSKSGSAGWVAVDDTNVYWTDPTSGLVRTVPKSGIGLGQEATIAMNEQDPYIVTFDAQNVYFTTDNAIVTLEKGPYKRSPLISNVYPVGIFLDPTAVYWTDGQADNVHLYIHGASDVVVAMNQTGPNSITSDGQFVYWTNSLGGTVNKVDISGGLVTPLATGQQKPQSLVMDATTLYWADTGGGKIMKMPKAGGPPVALTAALSSPAYVVVDDMFAYFTVGDGTVRRVAK